jgi:hypothetical protein
VKERARSIQSRKISKKLGENNRGDRFLVVICIGAITTMLYSLGLNTSELASRFFYSFRDVE